MLATASISAPMSVLSATARSISDVRAASTLEPEAHGKHSHISLGNFTRVAPPSWYRAPERVPLPNARSSADQMFDAIRLQVRYVARKCLNHAGSAGAGTASRQG